MFSYSTEAYFIQNHLITNGLHSAVLYIWLQRGMLSVLSWEIEFICLLDPSLSWEAHVQGIGGREKWTQYFTQTQLSTPLQGTWHTLLSGTRECSHSIKFCLAKQSLNASDVRKIIRWAFGKHLKSNFIVPSIDLLLVKR